MYTICIILHKLTYWLACGKSILWTFILLLLLLLLSFSYIHYFYYILKIYYLLFILCYYHCCIVVHCFSSFSYCLYIKTCLCVCVYQPSLVIMCNIAKPIFITRLLSVTIKKRFCFGVCGCCGDSCSNCPLQLELIGSAVELKFKLNWPHDDHHDHI